MTAFAEPADLTARYDYRVLGQLLADDGVALTESQVLASSLTDMLLEDASGEIVSKAVKGGRYSEADLLALTGNGQAFLKRLTCNLAMYFAVVRRGLPVDQYPEAVRAYEVLEALATGHAIFPVQANIEAGVAQSPPITVETIVSQNFLTTSTPNYFPVQRLTEQQFG